jgi:hypothetical protein
MAEGRKFPSFDAYQAILQHPETCFASEDLKSCSVETDLLGFPRVRSGGFALTYRVKTKTNQLAVRCFHKNVQDRYIRYQAIAAHIYHHNNPNLIKVQYIGKGVKVGKNWFPITLMPWVDGDTLGAYIYKNLGTKSAIETLLVNFIACIGNLQKVEIAHGDLSHQNIMVRNGEIYLVDYDGMYVPNLKGRDSCEIGHNNFQHPGRSPQHFSENLDRFSAIVIFLALKALVIHPDLWKKYEQSGDGLLFRKKDFIHPYESELLQELDTYHSLRKYIYIFRKICLSRFENIPSLDDFIHLNVHDLPHDEVYAHKVYSIDREIALDATKRYPLINHIGQIVTVVGQVQDFYPGKTKDNQPHIYLNFGNWKARCFTVLLWGEGYDHYSKLFPEMQEIIGKWISISGLLTIYHHRPQIAIDTPYGLEILADPQAASYRLGVDTVPIQQPIVIPVPVPQNRQQVNLPSPVTPTPIYQNVDMKKMRSFDRMIQMKINALYEKTEDHKSEGDDPST